MLREMTQHARALSIYLGMSSLAGNRLQATFMGRSVPVLAGAWAASQMASRSYVFGRDDSNSAAAPTDGVSGGGQVQPLSWHC